MQEEESAARNSKKKKAAGANRSTNSGFQVSTMHTSFHEGNKTINMEVSSGELDNEPPELAAAEEELEDEEEHAVSFQDSQDKFEFDSDSEIELVTQQVKVAASRPSQ